MTKIAIAEDHRLFRETFAFFCTQFGYDVVTTASNGMDILDKLLTCTLPEIIFMDIRMPLMNGKDATDKITRQYPSVKVIVLSSYEHEKHIIDMLNAGAKGYITKQAGKSEIMTAVEVVLTGNYHYSAEMLNTWNLSGLIAYGGEKKKHKSTLLNEREYEFISRCASDDSYKQIAEKMGVTYKTIDSFRETVCAKLKIATRSGLATYSVSHGLAPLRDDGQHRRC